jgi:hypothetical protein
MGTRFSPLCKVEENKVFHQSIGLDFVILGLNILCDHFKRKDDMNTCYFKFENLGMLQTNPLKMKHVSSCFFLGMVTPLSFAKLGNLGASIPLL